MKKIYKMLSMAQTDDGLTLCEFDMEFDGEVPFAILTYYEKEGRTAKQRVELDPLKFQPHPTGQKWKTAKGEFDYFYQGLIIVPKPQDN